MLMVMLPHAAKAAVQERKIVINEDLTRLHVSLDKEASANLERLREILSHKFPKAKSADLIAYALQFVLNDLDPLRKIQNAATPTGGQPSINNVAGRLTQPPQGKSPPITSAAEAVRVKTRPSVNTRRAGRISKGRREKLIRKAGGRCTFRDPVSGKVCGSRFQLEIDHIQPRALGGSNDPSNLRVLCRQHNQRAARKIFGASRMAKHARPF